MIRPTAPGHGTFQSQHFPPKLQANPRPTLFLPTQLQRAGVKSAPSAPSAPIIHSFPAANPSLSQPSTVGTAVISNKPVLYLPDKEAKPTAAASAPTPSIKAPPPVKKQKTETTKSSPAKPSGSSGPSVLKAPSSTVGSATVKSGGEEPKVQKMKKPKKFVRAAGGTVWQDDSLLDWDPSKYDLIWYPILDSPS